MRTATMGCLIALLATSGCVLRGAPVSPYGRQAQVRPQGTLAMRGELIAATQDTIWIFNNHGLLPYTTAELRRVDVQRHRFGMGRTMRWMGWTGLATGAALMVACNSYEASSDGSGDSGACFGVISGTVLFFGLAGVLFGSINEYTSKFYIHPSETERLRPFTRFPQGLPDSARTILGPIAIPQRRTN
jgi:hypothetical protein